MGAEAAQTKLQQLAKTHGWTNIVSDANGIYLKPPGETLQDLGNFFNTVFDDFGLHDLVPKELLPGDIRLESLALTNPNGKPALQLSVVWDTTWTLDIVQIHAPRITLYYNNGASSADLSGTLTLCDLLTMAVDVELPAGIIKAQMPKANSGTTAYGSTEKLSLIKLADHIGLPASTGKATNVQTRIKQEGKLSIDALQLMADVRNKSFIFHLALENVLNLGKLQVSQLQTELIYRSGAQGQTSGSIWGVIVIGESSRHIKRLEIDVFAAINEDGWQFSGSLGAAQMAAPSADHASENGISLGDVVKDLEILFCVTPSAPAVLNKLKLNTLAVSFNSATKDVDFFLDVSFAESGAADLQLHVAFTHTGDDKYTHTFSGSLLMAGNEFDLLFSEQTGGKTSADNDETFFIADYKNVGGQSLNLGDLLSTVTNDRAIIDIASELDIDLKDAILAYVSAPNNEGSADSENGASQSDAGSTHQNSSAKAGSHILFGADLGLGANLSHLPLLGKIFPTDKALSVLFQPLLASQEFTSALLAQICALIPNGSIALPQRDVSKGPHLITKLKIGDEVANLALPFKLGDQGEISDSPATDRPAAETAGVESADNALTGGSMASTGGTPGGDTVTWFNVQQSIGPIHFQKVGIQYQQGDLWFLLDASLSAAGFELVLDGLGAGLSLQDIMKKVFDPQFTLRGLGLDFQEGPLQIGGSFLRQQVTYKGDTFDAYDGMLTLGMEVLSLSAIGSYARYQGHNSVFIYLVLDYPIGGPEFFFVNGLAAGFGFNRDFIAPAIDKVHTFPLVAQAIAPPGPPLPSSGQDRFALLNQQMAELQNYIPPRIGQYFLAAGLRYTSFELFDSFTLLAVAFGKELEIDVLGVSTAAIPTPEEGSSMEMLAEIQTDIKATYVPDLGVLTFRAQLTENSYILDRACHLTGGLAFYAWFKGDADRGIAAGEFVFTIGGYHKKFKPPQYYPHVPKLGFNWRLNSEIGIKGDAYFALTPHALMAGGHLEALWHSGPLSAWFKAGADFLISWKPFHYDAEIYVSIGAKLVFHFFGTHHVTVSIGGDLHLWGPKFAGSVHISYYIVSFTIHFGDSKQTPTPLTWAQFHDSFLAAPKKQVAATGKHAKSKQMVGTIVQNGLVATVKDADTDIWIVNPKTMALVTNSVVPSTEAEPNAVAFHSGKTITKRGEELTIGEMGIAPMARKPGSVKSTHQILIEGPNNTPRCNDDFDFSPVLKSGAAALWGDSLLPDLNGNRVVRYMLFGFTVTPRRPVKPGETHPIAKQNLAYDTTPIHHAFRFERAANFQRNQAQTRHHINQQIMQTTTVSQRNELLTVLGFNTPDLLVDLGTSPANQLVAEPQVGSLFAHVT